MLKLKSLLNEGFAWERKDGKSLPTLAEVQAEYERNLKETEGAKPDYRDADNDGNETESWKKAEQDKLQGNDWKLWVDIEEMINELTRKYSGKVAKGKIKEFILDYVSDLNESDRME